MADTSTSVLKDFISKYLVGYDRTILEHRNNPYEGNLDSRNTDIIKVPGGEEIVAAYANISITGTERPKPQIRVFMDKTREAYLFAKEKQMRFFLFTIFNKDIAMARNILYYDPRDYLLAIETNIDQEESRRDLRSMYDYLDSYIGNNGPVSYLRCSWDKHQSGVYQASFIKIFDKGTPIVNDLISYMTYFDSRPYMNSISAAKSKVEETPVTDMGYPHNRIVFGAPGTGKSYRLERDSKVFGDNMERVTFHPHYSYSQFIGTYKPMKDRDKADGAITYEFVPGPFMRIYKEAVKPENADKNYLLLIEEINRANAAAVFGDVFQLLDRKHGRSEYPIGTSEDIKNYLLSEWFGNDAEYSDDEIRECSQLSLPPNMYIWATMNSADQGVNPMDTAFKRRWDFEYIGVDDEEQTAEIEDYYIPFYMDIKKRSYLKWKDVRNGINQILSRDDCKVNEDKLLGPFFISKTVLDEIGEIKAQRDKLRDEKTVGADFTEINRKEEQFIKAFESKVIMYLFEDVMKMNPSKIFPNHKGRKIFSDICRTFEETGEAIFGFSDEIEKIEYGQE